MSSVSTDLDQYSVLSDAEEHTIALFFFVMIPILLALSFVIFMVLSRDLNNLLKIENTYYKATMKCGWIASLSTMLMCITDIFFCNDLIIGWKYTSSKHTFVALSDSFVWLFALITKIAFYFGFTFHFHSIIYSYKSQVLPLFLKILMIFVAVWLIAVSIITITDDALVNSTKEIGVTLKHNIYMTMLGSHEKDGFNIIELFALITIFIDMSYFAILMYLYVSRLKQMDNESQQKGVKGLVLLITSCIFFWIMLIPTALNLSFKYIAFAMDIFADVLCLFLLFKSGVIIYDNLCGCLCHNCCGTIFFGANYKKLHEPDASDNTDAQTDSLL